MEQQEKMVRISVEVRSGTARFRVGVQAPSIRKALEHGREELPAGRGRSRLPQEPEGFFVHRQTQKEAA